MAVKEIDDIVLSRKYLVNVNEMLLDSDEFSEPVANVVKTGTDRAIQTSLMLKKLFKRFAQPAEMIASVRLSPWNESHATDVSDEGSRDKGYSIKESAKEDHWTRNTESWDCRIGKGKNFKKSKSACKSA